ncbi:MAG: hypothetical protein R3D78_06710 [Paracoccaceae bacterium]
MAAANGAARMIVQARGSTPAAYPTRLRGAEGGLILSASHNPGGPEGDFVVKYNIATAAPPPRR